MAGATLPIHWRLLSVNERALHCTAVHFEWGKKRPVSFFFFHIYVEFAPRGGKWRNKECCRSGRSRKWYFTSHQPRLELDQTITGETIISGGTNLGCTRSKCCKRQQIYLSALKGFLKSPASRRLLIMGFFFPLGRGTKAEKNSSVIVERNEGNFIGNHFVLSFKVQSNYAIAGTEK